jgi:hypothetical protein
MEARWSSHHFRGHSQGWFSMSLRADGEEACCNVDCDKLRQWAPSTEVQVAAGERETKDCGVYASCDSPYSVARQYNVGGSSIHSQTSRKWVHEILLG